MKKDIEIQKAIMEELKSVPLLNTNEIGVAVKNGVVTLSGMVMSYPQKIKVEKATKKVVGVKGIAEDIEVNLQDDHKKNDTEIARMVVNVLEWHSAVQIDNVQVLVEDGWVTIEGTVDWDFQRKSATEVIQNTKGVKGIINNIKIAGKPTPIDIQRKIQDAFVRNAKIDAKNIKITTLGNKVVLSGIVNSWSEYEEAEQTVWSTPGVSTIENNLEFEDDF